MRRSTRSSRAWCAKTAELLAPAPRCSSRARSLRCPRRRVGGVRAATTGASRSSCRAHPRSSAIRTGRRSARFAMTKYWLRVGDALLAVELHDIPAVAAALVSDDRILDQARDSLLRDVGGTLVESRAVEFSGAPARDFRYRLPGEAQLEERVLAVLVDTRLYLVTGHGARAGSAIPRSHHLWPRSAAGARWSPSPERPIAILYPCREDCPDEAVRTARVPPDCLPQRRTCQGGGLLGFCARIGRAGGGAAARARGRRAQHHGTHRRVGRHQYADNTTDTGQNFEQTASAVEHHAGARRSAGHGRVVQRVHHALRDDRRGRSPERLAAARRPT